MTRDDIIALHKKYSLSQEQFELCFNHCEIVEEIALWCATNTNEQIDLEALSAAALLHDIGCYPLMDIKGVPNNKLYHLHAIFGSKLLEEEGVDKRICEIIETHITSAVSKAELVEMNKAAPHKDMTPKSIEAEILRYADRYHSKVPQFNSYDFFRSELDAKLPKQVAVVEEYAKKYGKPDLNMLSKKYKHPIDKSTKW